MQLTLVERGPRWWRTISVFAFLCVNLTFVGMHVILAQTQYTYIVGKYIISKEDSKTHQRLAEDSKTHQRLAFRPVSKVRINRFYICRQCTFMYIVYVISVLLMFLKCKTCRILLFFFTFYKRYKLWYFIAHWLRNCYVITHLYISSHF